MDSKENCQSSKERRQEKGQKEEHGWKNDWGYVKNVASGFRP
jgi:hypothetical protein